MMIHKCRLRQLQGLNLPVQRPDMRKYRGPFYAATTLTRNGPGIDPRADTSARRGHPFPAGTPRARRTPAVGLRARTRPSRWRSCRRPVGSAGTVILLVTPDVQSAARLEHELRFLRRRVGPARAGLPRLGDPSLRRLRAPAGAGLRAPDGPAPLPRMDRGVLVAPVANAHAAAVLRAISWKATPCCSRSAIACRSTRPGAGSSAPGYQCVSQVMAHGEFAVRGSLLDIFPMGAREAYRIDLFDDEVDSIRTFDPETQRSLDKVKEIRLLPAREFPVARGRHRAFSPGVPRDLRGRSAAQPRLPRGQRGPLARGHRVLSAAVLRRDRHPFRFPARGHGGALSSRPAGHGRSPFSTR